MTDEEIRIVRDKPLTIILTLPDGVIQGRWQAAEAFSEGIAQMRARYPNETFQLLPFNYDMTQQGPSISAILAIAD